MSTLIKVGKKVRMTETFKAVMRKDCIDVHKGPMVGNDCWGCSGAHVDEFGGCTGVVEDTIPDSNLVNVRWKPSMLRYAYDRGDLERV